MMRLVAMPNDPSYSVSGRDRAVLRLILGALCALLMLVAVPVVAVPSAPGQQPGESSQAVPEKAPLSFPEPNLDGLEDAIAEQLRSAQRSIEEVSRQYGRVAVARAIGTLGQLYHAYDLVGAAMSCYQTAASETEDLQWSYYLAHVLRDNGQFEGSNEQFAEILRRGGDRLVEVQYYLGANHLELGDLDAAEQAFLAGVALRSDDPSLIAGLGEVALARGEATEAIERLERALKLQPGANRLHYPLAQAYQSLGDRATAKSHFERFGQVGVRPADPLLDDLEKLRVGSTPHVLAGRIAFGAGRYEEAVEAFELALEARPGDVGHSVNLATALDRAGRRAEAMSTYRQALEIDADAQTALYNLGVLERLEGELEVAVQHLGRAVALNGDDLAARRELARAQRAIGDLDSAVENFRRIRQIDSLDEVSWFGEASVLVDLGRYAEGRAVLEAALESVPRSLRVRQGLARLLSGSPDETVRDAPAAALQWQQIYRAEPTVDHAIAFAQALVALQRCGEAAALVERILATDGLDEALSEPQLQQMSAWQAALASGEACRG